MKSVRLGNRDCLYIKRVKKKLANVVREVWSGEKINHNGVNYPHKRVGAIRWKFFFI